MAFKYRGILAKPCSYDPPHGPLADEATRAAWIDRYTADAEKRARALFEAHGAEYGDDKTLLARLIEAHVPGFRRKKRSGPRRVWGPFQDAELRIAVDEYRARRKLEGKPASISQACNYLATQEPWRTMLRKGKNPPVAPRGHYDKALPVWVELVRHTHRRDALLARDRRKGMTLGDLASFAMREITSK